MRKQRNTESEEIGDTAAEVAALRRELHVLNQHRFVRLHNKPGRLMMFRFISGVFTGLGTVVGATVFVSFIILALREIEFVPILGELAAQVATRMEEQLAAPQPASDAATSNDPAPVPAPGTPEGLGVTREVDP